MHRSKKPSIRKNGQKSGRRMTQEELDYSRYVEGITFDVGNNNQTHRPPRHS